jgi:hypothetical protein
MKKYVLLIIVVITPVFAGQVVADLAESVSSTEIIGEMPVSFTPSRGETLKYDNGVFNNGIGIHGPASIPLDWQTYGWATYFVLHEFGITTTTKVSALMVYPWNIITATDFRLYVWRNVEVPPGILRPWSHFVEFPYCSLHVPLPPAQTWGTFDISSENVILPDTFWVGVCYNEITDPNASWYLGVNQNLSDNHTYVNLGGGPSAWEPTSDFPYPYGVRVIVEELLFDVGPLSIDLDTLIFPGAHSPQATVKNFGANTATFDVTCEIDPGGYSSTETVTDLAAGDSIQVTFTPDFTFAENTYTVAVFTDLSGDENPGNDTLTKDIVVTGISEGGEAIPEIFLFRAPTINTGYATIQFALPQATTVALTVYDALGRLRATLVSERCAAGTHSIDTQFNFPAGIYFYHMNAGTGEKVVQKFILVE